MAEEEEERKDSGGFLPPQPGGPQGPQSPAPSSPAPGDGWQQPPSPPGRQAPPPPPAPPGQRQQPPSSQQAPPYGQQPPPYGQPQPYAGQQPYGQQPLYAPPPRDPNDPGNTPAIVSLVLGVVSIGLLFISIGFSSILSLGLGIGGIVLGVNARRRVRDGVTRQHKDLGTAGFAVSIGATVLSAVATLFWGLVIIGVASSDESDFHSDFDTDTLLPRGVVSAAGHTLATLLG